jgi:pSer/pThr/pTyr-binding forkhead associated (FHA) protein
VDLDTSIFVLRCGATGLLYTMLLGVVIVVWRDWKVTARLLTRTRQTSSRSLGRLIVIERGQTELLPGQSIPLSVITGIGRAPTNTVVLGEPFASNEHARLYRRNGRWWLEDLGSRNGTLLNGERLRACTIVVTGDLVGIGGVQMRIELEEG